MERLIIYFEYPLRDYEVIISKNSGFEEKFLSFFDVLFSFFER